MMQILETAIVLLAVALALAWLAKRFWFNKKQGCDGSSACKCSKPVVPNHIKRGDLS